MAALMTYHVSGKIVPQVWLEIQKPRQRLKVTFPCVQGCNEEIHVSHGLNSNVQRSHDQKEKLDINNNQETRDHVSEEARRTSNER